MELICDLNAMRTALAHVTKITSGTVAVETLRYINLMVQNNALTLIGLSSGILARESINVDAPFTYAASFPGKQLQAIMDQLPGPTCKLSFQGTKLTISSKRVRYQLNLSEFADVVDIPQPHFQQTEPFDVGKLVSLLKAGIRTCSRDTEGNKPINSVIQFGAEFISATDSATLLYVSNTFLPVMRPFNMAVSAAIKIAPVLASCAHHYNIPTGLAYQEEDRLFLQVGSFRVYTMEVALPFKDMRASLKFEPTCTFTAKKEDLYRCLSQVAAGASDGEMRRGTVIVAPDGMRVVGNYKTGTAEAFLEQEIAIGEPMQLYFDLDRLLKVLDGLGESISVSLSTPVKPARFKDNEYEYYTVPLRF